MILNVVIVDDEPKNIRILQELVNNHCKDAVVTGSASNISDAAKVIAERRPDVVLLDIEMPHGNAFDLLDKIMPVEFEIIFVTAFDEYALKAFKYAALDYLLKPVSIEDLQSALNRASERRRIKNPDMRLTNFLDNLHHKDLSSKKLALQLPGKDYEFVAIADVLYCESKKGYTYIFIEDNKQFVISKSLKELEDLLPGDLFFRVHHSYLVNLKKVKKYINGRGGTIEMHNNAIVEVAARRKEELLSKLQLK